MTSFARLCQLPSFDKCSDSNNHPVWLHNMQDVNKHTVCKNCILTCVSIEQKAIHGHSTSNKEVDCTVRKCNTSAVNDNYVNVRQSADDPDIEAVELKIRAS